MIAHYSNIKLKLLNTPFEVQLGNKWQFKSAQLTSVFAHVKFIVGGGKLTSK